MNQACSAVLTLNRREAYDRLDEINTYLEEHGRAPFTLNNAETQATASWPYFSEDEQVDLLLFIADMSWDFIDDAHIKLLPDSLMSVN